MEQLVLAVDTSKDNDSVLADALELLKSNGTHGWSSLRDALNGAYTEDMKLSRSADRLGRASMHEALEAHEAGADWGTVRGTLLRGLVLRAARLGAL